MILTYNLNLTPIKRPIQAPLDPIFAIQIP